MNCSSSGIVVIKGRGSSICTRSHDISATRRKKSMESPFFSISLNTPLRSSSSSSATLLCHRTRTRSSVRAAVGHRFIASMLDKSFYQLLEISESVSFLEIKHAYKQMARKYHPDVSPADQMEENTRRFIRVQEAYETLSDPRQRALYDRDLAKGLHLAFSVRRCDEGLGERSEWRNCWQGQVAELKRRSMNKDSGESVSWGARMRRQRNLSSEE